MKVYTGIGDKGTTNILGASKIPKDDARVDAYGNVDELNTCIGWISTFPLASNYLEQLRQIQHTLFNIGTELASTPKALSSLKFHRVKDEDYKKLEIWIDVQTEQLPALRSFILPGSCAENAACHLGRTVCRRAERSVVHLGHHTEISPALLIYLNRLSDYLFTLARTMTSMAGSSEVEWHGTQD